MSLNEVNDHFIFIYGLEPSELCSNFRFDSGNFWTLESPVRIASFSVWKSMLVVFYGTIVGKYSFDGLSEEAHYFATAIVTCYGLFTGKPIQLTRKNWVGVEGQTTKTIAGTFQNPSNPPTNHTDNDVLKRIATLMPLILKTPPLARALQDYHSCLSKVDPDFYFYAYRAVEDIRSYFGATENDDERRNAWNSMNKALNREKKDYTELFDFAKESRHANKLGEVVDQEAAQKQVTFVGSLIVAFIKYLSESNHPSKLDSPKNPPPT